MTNEWSDEVKRGINKEVKSWISDHEGVLSIIKKRVNRIAKHYNAELKRDGVALPPEVKTLDTFARIWDFERGYSLVYYGIWNDELSEIPISWLFWDEEDVKKFATQQAQLVLVKGREEMIEAKEQQVDNFKDDLKERMQTLYFLTEELKRMKKNGNWL